VKDQIIKRALETIEDYKKIGGKWKAAANSIVIGICVGTHSCKTTPAEKIQIIEATTFLSEWIEKN